MDMSNSVTYSDKMETALNTPPLLCRDIKSRKARMNCSNGSTFTAGQEIRIPITLQNGVIAQNSAMFYGTLRKTGVSQEIEVDFSTFCLFDSVRVEAGAGGGATILELCDDIGVFHSFLTMNTSSLSDLQYNNQTTGGASGFNNANAVVPAIAGVAAGVAFPAIPAVAVSVNNVYDIYKGGEILTESTTNVNKDLFFALNLSEAMGLFTQNIVLSGTTGICLVLRVAQITSQVVYELDATYPTPPSLSVNQPYLMATILEGGDKYEKALKDMKSGPNGEVSIMFNTYSRYVQNIAGSSDASGNAPSQSNIQLLISDTAKSALGYVAIARSTASITDPELYKNSSSGWNLYQNHALSVGGVLYPQNPISSAIENYEEVRDLYKIISRRHNFGSLLNRNQGLVGSAYNGEAIGPAAVIAVNLCKCDDKNVWGIGANTTGAQSVFLQVSYAPPEANTIHIFALRQQKVHIDGMGNFSVEK